MFDKSYFPGKHFQMTRQLLLLIFLLAFSLSSCKIGRFVFYNKANITDYKVFPSRPIETGDSNFSFPKVDNRLPFDSLTITAKGEKKRQKFEDYLIDNETVAFLIIQNDTLIYENYFNGYDETSIVNSFSMAKSVTSMLIGCALEEGLIESTEDPITKYLPELKDNGFESITIEHLLDMRSGIKFKEEYLNPFGHVATFYYGTNLRKAIGRLKLEHKPGKILSYRSVDTQLLGLLLERVLNGRTITSYLEEKIWQPLGMEYPASWSLDRKKNGLEKTFCCLNARARDFAKLGRLYLNEGNWNGRQVVPAHWVRESVQDTSSSYNNQWWLNKNGVFAAEGILGQFISVHPKKNLVIVRLGKKYGKIGAWEKIFKLIEEKI